MPCPSDVEIERYLHGLEVADEIHMFSCEACWNRIFEVIEREAAAHAYVTGAEPGLPPAGATALRTGTWRWAGPVGCREPT